VTINLLNRAPVSSDADGIVTTDLLGSAVLPIYTLAAAPSGFGGNAYNVRLSALDKDESANFTVSGAPSVIKIEVMGINNNSSGQEMVRINIIGHSADPVCGWFCCDSRRSYGSQWHHHHFCQ
jgi:hypothetical protein